ncbi:MAG: ATP-binding protein [Clostridia bacterium]|nr:ATP-binding protein [Clostridia bacterium]
MKTDIRQLYNKMLGFAVFSGLLQRPLFARFLDFCAAERGTAAQLRAYGDFVHEIYAGGGNLTECVCRFLFEDENIYVKSIAADRGVCPHVLRAAEEELDALSLFSTLSPADLAAEMGHPPYQAGFAVGKGDLRAAYEKRVADIGRHGYGIFATSPMFSLGETGEILPIRSPDRSTLDRFVGYAEERARVIANTIAFLDGRSATNALLYGDAGTGKSSTVKAIVNEFFDRGLRLIEMRKDQLFLLPHVMGEIADNPLKFIIFIDDLSFNKNDDTFSMLKAMLEGSASARAKNAVIYATSNRRHIVKESFSDREGDDLHRNDTVQETLSLSERFGLTVLFAKPEKRLYLAIVHELAARAGIKKDAASLDTEAEAFALRRGYRSARCAEQFIESLL